MPALHIHQHFSDIADLDRKIKTRDQCNNVYSVLEEYRVSTPIDVSIKKLNIKSTPEWKHKVDVTNIIVMNTLSSPFDTISYYVFCSNKDIVIDTLLAGD